VQKLLSFAVSRTGRDGKIVMTTQAVIYQMWVDGAARGNPGKAGAGVYIRRGATELVRQGFFLGHQTNNSAEYLALALGLFLLKRDTSQGAMPLVKIYSDSQLLVRQMRGEYKVRMPHIQRIKMLVDGLAKQMQCTFEHVAREKNVVADALANHGIDEKVIMPAEFVGLVRAIGIEVPSL
jgi:ribonuclease HI